MRIFFKLLLLLGLLTNYVSANIDECKTDLYYANGIMMPDSEKDALKKWRKKAKSLLLSKPENYKKIADIKISYNVSQGFLDDLLESFEQMTDNEWGWDLFTAYFTVYLTEHGIQEGWEEHVNDLNNQVESYKKSIKNGHGVIVLAHSQGNYYTNEAYERLDDWMKEYFHMFGIATPANHVAGYEAGDVTAPYVKFHNDFIMLVVTGLPSNRDNPNPEHDEDFSVEAHDFYASYLTAENTKNDILGFIEQKIEEHTQAPSQWETDEEFEIDTKDYRITVKHRYDPSVNALIWEKVYPFAPSKKLYQLETGEYVKASCGGKSITDSWEGQDTETEFWKIDNPQEEKIRGKSCTFVINGEEYCETGTFVHSYTTATGYYPSVWYKKAGSNMGQNIDWAFGLNPFWNTSKVKSTTGGVYPYNASFEIKYDGITEYWTDGKHVNSDIYTASNGATLQIGNVDIHQGCNIRVKYLGDEDMNIGEY